MNKDLLQEKLYKMQQHKSYRLLTYENGHVKSMPELKKLSAYLIMTDSEWLAKNGDQAVSSNQQPQNKVIFAETDNKLFLPTADKTALYVSPNHTAPSSSVFAYFLIGENDLSVGFLGATTTGKYYTLQLPCDENKCLCIIDSIMPVFAKFFPDDLDKLRTLFRLGSKYNAGNEDIWEE